MLTLIRRRHLDHFITGQIDFPATEVPFPLIGIAFSFLEHVPPVPVSCCFWADRVYLSGKYRKLYTKKEPCDHGKSD